MPLKLRWIGEDELDRVAQTRLYCYAPAGKDLATYKEKIRADRRAKVGDFLLAERDGVAVGTTTALSMTMWVRGAALPCQGVAYVGTIKTHRRGGGASGEQGVATQLMFETLRRARERREVVSALMPFRASFYEHFGYGLIERRHEWLVPLSILPPGDFDGFNFIRNGDDLPAMIECRQRMVQNGQCDIERTPEAWETYRRNVGEGFEVVDREPGGAVHGSMYFTDTKTDGRTTIRVADQVWDSAAALLRQLHFLASLKDQYSYASLTLPSDIQLNRVLRESQLPHRLVEHAVAKLTPITRCQVRILDHMRFLESLKWPANTKGRATIAVKECEGQTSKFKLDVSGGRAQVAPSDASPDLELTDKDWAAIACGDLTATSAAQLGVLHVSRTDALSLLDALSVGPAPFCAEYF
jgi:predicted acetyltransferase